jgi:hypothetical protein
MGTGGVRQPATAYTRVYVRFTAEYVFPVGESLVAVLVANNHGYPIP